MDYSIRRASRPLGQPTAAGDHALWAGADELQVANFPWEDSGHRPRVRARALWDAGWLAVRFEVDDRWVRAVAQKWNDSVCADSCVEFFIAPSPDPERDDYFNFEVNCGGTMLLYACPSRSGGAAGKRGVHVTPEDGATIRIAHTLPKVVDPELAEPTTWAVEYHVPWGLFVKYFGVAAPAPGTTWRANFYKCADKTSHPHWGSWAPVATPRPNFHKPEFFQAVRFA